MPWYAGKHVERRVRRQWVDGLSCEIIIVVGLAIGFVQGHPDRIQNGRTERVRLFQDCGLPVREEIYKNLVEGLGKAATCASAGTRQFWPKQIQCTIAALAFSITLLG